MKKSIIFLGALTAILVFSSAVLLYAAESDIYISKGIQKLNEGKLKDAEEFFEKAVKLAPDDPEASY